MKPFFATMHCLRLPDLKYPATFLLHKNGFHHLQLKNWIETQLLHHQGLHSFRELRMSWLHADSQRFRILRGRYHHTLQSPCYTRHWRESIHTVCQISQIHRMEVTFLSNSTWRRRKSSTSCWNSENCFWWMDFLKTKKLKKKYQLHPPFPFDLSSLPQTVVEGH